MAKSIDEIVESKHPTFANIIKDMKSVDELNKNLIVYLRQKEDLVIKKARDPELNKLKVKKAELAKPYNQTITALNKMTNCIYKFGHKFEAELKTEFEKNLVLYAKQLSHVKYQKDNDRELVAVGSLISDINEDYNPTIKLLELKAGYITWYIKVRFGTDEVKEIEI